MSGDEIEDRRLACVFLGHHPSWRLAQSITAGAAKEAGIDRESLHDYAL
jgi:hypothetical protein